MISHFIAITEKMECSIKKKGKNTLLILIFGVFSFWSLCFEKFHFGQFFNLFRFGPYRPLTTSLMEFDDMTDRLLTWYI